MTQKSELTPEKEPYPVDYPETNNTEPPLWQLVDTKLDQIADDRGLEWNLTCTGEDTIYSNRARDRKVIFVEKSRRPYHNAPVKFCIELDRWFKEHWNIAYTGDRSESDIANDLTRYIIMELDSLRAKRAESFTDKALEANHIFIEACATIAKENNLEFKIGTTISPPDHMDGDVVYNLITFIRTFDLPIKIGDEPLKKKSMTFDLYSDGMYGDCFTKDGVFDYVKALPRTMNLVYDQLLSYSSNAEDAHNPLLDKEMNVPDCDGSNFFEDIKAAKMPDFFVEMFQEHGVSAIRREAPAIPKEWVEEYAKTDDFRYLCEAAAQCCRSFCDFLHKKLDSKEEK